MIDNPTHPLLTMVSLRAVVPKRLLILHQEGKHLVCLATSRSKVEAGEDAAAAGERLAGCAEGRLHDAVVLGEEVEFNEVADGGDDVLGLEVEAGVFGGGARCYTVDDAGCGDGVWGCGGEAEEGKCEGGKGEHVGWWSGFG